LALNAAFVKRRVRGAVDRKRLSLKRLGGGVLSNGFMDAEDIKSDPKDTALSNAIACKSG